MAPEAAVGSIEQNIEVVRQLYMAFAKQDIPGMIALLDPAIEWGEPANPYNPCGGTRRGIDGFKEWLQIGRAAEEILILEPRKFLVDADSVAVGGFIKVLAKPTGREYETEFVHLITVRNGKIVKFQEFFDTYIAGEAFRP